MKKLIVISFLFLLQSEFKAQQYLSYDSIHRHEISVSVLPVINVLSGSFSNSTYTNFNFGYKYYFPKYAFRTAFVFFPSFNGYNSGFSFYDRTVGNRIVFRRDHYRVNPKLQLNIGFEKLFKYNRLVHGIGVDVSVNNSTVRYGTDYYYRPYGFNSNAPVNFGDTTNYAVDSLSYSVSEKKIGLGLQVFYSIRYKISKRFYLSATIGPSLNFSFVNGQRYEARTKETQKYKATQFDFPNVGFISDISICFRL